MSTTLPPMHAALSVLGTMAGQYLASQAQAVQAAAAQTNSLCDVCHAKPKYFDGTKTHSSCSKTCAAKMPNRGTTNNPPQKRKSTKPASQLCDYCHKQPKYNDGTTTHSFCGKTCAKNAKAAGIASAPAKSLKNGCLICGSPKKKGHFCSQTCHSKATKKAPVLLEVPQGHDTFGSVSDQFKASWRHQTSCPTVRRVYKVIGHPTSIAKYEAYRAQVEARGNFAATGRSPGNENRRWHGTTRECLLGDNGNSSLCSSQSCSAMWDPSFGAGIYTSSTSSKSNDYSNNVKPSKLKAVLLNKVVVGRGYKMMQDNTSLTAPPPGYDSVLAEVATGGSLNYDELVCYTENAIRPSYLVMYDA
ncbi:ADP-ribosylation [Pisolithus orientalis]|uniref:ADP-ribosylation n=1 Tax=Pisolithus orientalis TaxID=936130 RepID=UPI002224FF35|nr:ADP-ribosylation [Pisolithus orientalis]KAI6025841.1 ADP-ribosylation [Pisolithus orientalis]